MSGRLLLLLVWLFAGLPLLVLVSLWGGSLWLPFPIQTGESFSYYVAWLIALLLIYVPPVAVALSYLMRLKR